MDEFLTALGSRERDDDRNGEQQREDDRRNAERAIVRAGGHPIVLVEALLRDGGGTLRSYNTSACVTSVMNECGWLTDDCVCDLCCS